MKKIILASASPRRKEILMREGFEFEIKTADIDEDVDPDLLPEEVAMYLSLEKALVIEKESQDEMIIAADTIVYRDKVLGKPKDYKEAYEMLKSLQGKSHEVITGVAIIVANTNSRLVFHEKTIVEFKAMNDQEIDAYIQTDEVWDKAGAYAIQGLGGQYIDSIKGDYDNVVGLPIERLKKYLEAFDQ